MVLPSTVCKLIRLSTFASHDNITWKKIGVWHSFPTSQFKVRKLTEFNQPVTTNRLTFLPAATQIYLFLVLWKRPWLLEPQANGSQRGREGGRSPFPVLQEVTLLLLKKQVYPRKPRAAHVREPRIHTNSLSATSQHIWQGHCGQEGGGTAAE